MTFSDVKLLAEPPAFTLHKKPVSKRLQTLFNKGIRYEKRIAKAVEELYGSDRVICGPWFSYMELGNLRFCQPDFVILPGDPRGTSSSHVIIGEVKLSWQEDAQEKLETLYAPIVTQGLAEQISRGISKSFPTLVQVFRNLPDLSILEPYTLADLPTLPEGYYDIHHPI